MDQTMTGKAVDLAALDTTAASEQGMEFELMHPVTEEPLGVFLTIAGADSATWRRAVSEMAEKRKNRKVTAEAMRQGGIEIIARCTLAWRNVVLDGEEKPCTLANARELYTRFPWIREQADAFAGERANFLPA